MVTLAKRALPPQARILRIIEGAVLNAADAHGRTRDEQMARSIAKRATGTLSSQWGDVLAASTRPSETGRQSGSCRACERRKAQIRLCTRRERAIAMCGAAADSFKTAAPGRGPPQWLRRSPLLELWTRLQREMWPISRSNQLVPENKAKYEAYVHLLRMIDALHKESIENG